MFYVGVCDFAARDAALRIGISRTTLGTWYSGWPGTTARCIAWGFVLVVVGSCAYHAIMMGGGDPKGEPIKDRYVSLASAETVKYCRDGTRSEEDAKVCILGMCKKYQPTICNFEIKGKKEKEKKRQRGKKAKGKKERGKKKQREKRKRGKKAKGKKNQSRGQIYQRPNGSTDRGGALLLQEKILLLLRLLRLLRGLRLLLRGMESAT